MNHPFPKHSAAQTRNRRPLRKKGERQSGYRCVTFSAFSQFTDSVLLHMRFHLRKRDMTVSRNLFVWCPRTAPPNYTLATNFTVGCDDLGAPHLTIGVPANRADTLIRPYEVCSPVVYLCLSFSLRLCAQNSPLKTQKPPRWTVD